MMEKKWAVRLALSLVAVSCSAQSLLPQIADGGNWRTAIHVVNARVAPSTVSLNCFRDTNDGATVSWNPPFVEMNSTENVVISAGGTLFLHTLGTDAALSQGWCRITGNNGTIAQAIYTYAGRGSRPDQDGTAEQAYPAARILVPFDNTSGFATSLAIVNPTSSPEAVSVSIYTDVGKTGAKPGKTGTA